MPDAYPLAWPAGRPRTPAGLRELAKFGRRITKQGSGGGSSYTQFRRGESTGRGRAAVLAELERLHASGIVISTDVELRLDGRPRVTGGHVPEPDDPGAAVYFMRSGVQLCLACDRFTRLGDNLRAIAATLEALRGIERWGTRGMMEAAFSGFRALPGLGETSGRGWWEVLDVEPGASLATIEVAYRARARELHPDKTGKREPWDELQEAVRQARDARRAS